MTLHNGSSTNFTELRKNPQKYVSKVEWDDDDGHVHWTYHSFRRVCVLWQLWTSPSCSLSCVDRASAVVRAAIDATRTSTPA
jgi:hypothetical protein